MQRIVHWVHRVGQSAWTQAAAVAVGLVVLCHSSLVWAAADVAEDPLSVIDSVVEAAKAGRWLLVAAGALTLAMFGLRKVRDRVTWFKGDRGGAILVILLSLGAALSTAFGSGNAVDWKLIVGAVAVAWTASGGYTNIRRILWPKDQAAAPPE